jgi:hypothetical protein
VDLGRPIACPVCVLDLESVEDYFVCGVTIVHSEAGSNLRFKPPIGEKMIMTRRILFGLAAAMALTVMVFAATSTVVVTGDGNGWTFNPDSSNATPYHFTTNAASIGSGSLFVEPISSTVAARKFIAAYALNTPVSNFVSFSYDFQIAGTGTVADADQYYLNIYTRLPNSTASFYDCRFDYTPSVGSTTSFMTFTVTPGSAPSAVGVKNSAPCPATLGAMPAGSTIFLTALNLGDTSLSDAGLAGYFDNVVVTTTTDSTTYDFEPSKDVCKDGGWKNFFRPDGSAFKNQGDCVQYVNTVK